MMRSDLSRAAFAIVMASLVGAASAQSADTIRVNPGANLRTSNSALDIGININAALLYGLGYTGTRSIIANIEGGRTWGGHDVFFNGGVSPKSILDITDYADDPGAAHTAGWGGSLGDYDLHATWVGHSMAGQDPSNLSALNTRRGIAYGATLWSAGIATEFGPHAPGAYSGSFNWSSDKVYITPYINALINGVNGKKADVTNSSWGFGEPTGYNNITIAGDAVAYQSKRAMFFSAGNSGNNGTTDVKNSVGGVGAGNNAITVGALGSDNTSKFNHRAYFSSHGPNDYTGPDGSATGVRARVDISAPGENLVLGYYGGSSGGDWGNAANPATNLYNGNVAGTSFSSPITAASASLLIDAAKDKGLTNVVDGRVIKALLLNGADKPAAWAGDGTDPIAIGAWDNGQAMVGGVLTTTQALDYNYGAGMLNVGASYHNMVDGTKDVSGLGGGSVHGTGWDYGMVTRNQGSDDYLLPWLTGGTNLTATLDWFTHDSIQGFDAANNVVDSRDKFANLDLQVWSLVGGVPGSLVAESKAAYITTQHLSFNLPGTSRYMLRVSYVGDRYNFDNTNNEYFGLAWRSHEAPVPEPATMALLGLGALGVLRRRNRKA